MFDIWAFLLQTLTASGVAVLLLAVKALFRDKLPPKWHFAIWGVLGLALVIPAGLGGRYVLFNWPLVVETLKTMLAGEYTYTHVLFPFPVWHPAMPGTLWEWLFAAYVLGVLFHLGKYAVSYLRLRSILRHGREADAEQMERIRRIGAWQQVRVGKVVTVPGLPSAFVCGVFRPVLALPADAQIDDKILLHELLHLKSRDTVWSIVLCIFRSIHWCNPLLVFCFDRAGNDLEARCDQRVLEQLEGEERRDYGRILLSMANDRFARTPGATCVNNGGSNIRQRIEAIARFKRYPAGMQLVSVCAAIILTCPLILGAEATEVYELDYTVPPQMAFASARSTSCTTPAGAFDAYGKAILDQNAIYRAMCAPVDQQKDLAEAVIATYESGKYPYWDIGLTNGEIHLDAWPSTEEGYYIYNLKQISDTAYEGLLVIRLNYRPDGMETEYGQMVVAYQKLRVEKEGQRWVTIPLEEFQWMETTREDIGWGISVLPGCLYSATAENIRVEVNVQTIHVVDNTVETTNDMNFPFGASTSYDMVPKPNAEFEWCRDSYLTTCIHLGNQSERDEIHHLAISTAPLTSGGDHPVMHELYGDNIGGGASSDGNSWSSKRLVPGWGPILQMGGGGGSGDPDVIGSKLPDAYAVDLYINGEKVAELTLTLQQGGPK